MMEKRKICMLGASGVGKSSLVSRFVRSIFSDAYRTTIGVSIEKRRVRWQGREVDLVIWDLSGEDEFEGVNRSYLRGASGILVVVDGTRRATVETALRLRDDARAIAGDVPCVLVVNKADLLTAWDLDPTSEAALEGVGCLRFTTSAKTGAGVDEAFAALARAMTEDDHTSRGA